MPTPPISWPFVTVCCRLHVGARERSVDRVVAAAVIDDHREAVRAELSDAHDLARRRPTCTLVPTVALMPTPFQRMVVLLAVCALPNV